MDHGAKFGAHCIKEDCEWNSDLKRHIERDGIKPILAKVKYPQTNGKLERWFGKYQKHRQAFSSLLGYEQKYELFTRSETWAGAKYFRDYTTAYLDWQEQILPKPKGAYLEHDDALKIFERHGIRAYSQALALLGYKVKWSGLDPDNAEILRVQAQISKAWRLQRWLLGEKCP
jgi:transposase InsO family protein